MTDRTWRSHPEALGDFIRAQRQLADLSLRDMAALANVSNAYLSQLERGLHQPSVRVLRAIGEALNVPPEELLAAAGLLSTRGQPATSPKSDAGDEGPPHVCSMDAAIASDPHLNEEQRRALLTVYRSFVYREK